MFRIYDAYANITLLNAYFTTRNKSNNAYLNRNCSDSKYDLS